MAIQYVVATAAGVSSASPNEQTDLAEDVADAIAAAEAANGAVGLKGDASTELAAVTTALEALTANQPSGAVVVSVDLEQITSRTQLRKVLDDVYRYLADSTNILT